MLLLPPMSSVTVPRFPDTTLFRSSPTNYAIETMMDRVAAHLKMDRIELRKRNLIRADQFPYMIPSGSSYDSGDYHTVIDKVLAHAAYAELKRERDRRSEEPTSELQSLMRNSYAVLCLKTKKT